MEGKSQRPLLEDLRLVPALNLASIVVPVAIMGAVAFATAAYDWLNPPPPMSDVPAAHVEINLEITETGFIVHGARGVFATESAEIDCRVEGCPQSDSYDQRGLAAALALVKRDYPMEKEVTIIPRPRTPFVVIMRTMDTSRDQFPYVTITSGE